MLESNLAHGLTRIEQLAVASPGRADLQQQAIDLRQTLRRAGISVETTLAGDPLDTWLILMALLTCTVGIANAMLMSVTERFREIATMKCLGAQDGLVVKMFLLESSLLGMIGALIGIALGIVVALATAGLQFGGYALSYFPWAEGWIVIGLSILAGMLLSVIGAVYPAILAARMRPVDALRVDE
jgi:putative ABC transport system permease protein